MEDQGLRDGEHGVVVIELLHIAKDVADVIGGDGFSIEEDLTLARVFPILSRSCWVRYSLVEDILGDPPGDHIQ
jgi:hypothetical protein